MRVFNVFCRTRHKFLRVFLGEIRAWTVQEAMHKAQSEFNRSIFELDLEEVGS